MANFKIISPYLAINVDNVKLIRGMAGSGGKKSCLMITYIDCVESPVYFENKEAMNRAWNIAVKNK